MKIKLLNMKPTLKRVFKTFAIQKLNFQNSIYQGFYGNFCFEKLPAIWYIDYPNDYCSKYC